MEINMKIMTLEQFAKENGLITEFDYSSECHSMASVAQNNVSKAQKRRQTALLNSMIQKFKETKRLYQEAVLRGEIHAPKELTTMERLLITANGDENLASTQGARRAVKKRLKRYNLECPVCGDSGFIKLEENIIRNSVITQEQCYICNEI